MTGKIYIVATPIGNLSDITLRALEVLKSVDFVASEDTRVSKKLLDSYEIKTRLVSYHQHSGRRKIDFFIRELRKGRTIALISDAGTPGISDPGNELIAELADEFPVIPVPGPSALLAGLSISGLPANRFCFLGFLPRKKGRRKIFQEIKEAKTTIAFYESPYRILKTLESLKDLGQERTVVVCRELTKKFETVYRGTSAELAGRLKAESIKGEFLVIVGPAGY